jgi:hypothetical protein
MRELLGTNAFRGYALHLQHVRGSRWMVLRGSGFGSACPLQLPCPRLSYDEDASRRGTRGTGRAHGADPAD